MTSASEQCQPVTVPSRSCFWEWDIKARQVWRSERFNQVFGQQTDEADESVDAWFARIHPDDREEVVSRLLTVVEQGGHWADEYRFLRTDGTYAPVYDQGFTVVRQNRVVRMTGYMVDLSAQQMQPDVAQADTDWTIALESAEMGTWLVDLNTRLVSCNRRCRGFLGYSTDDRIAIETLADQLHPADRDLMDRVMRQAFQTQSDGRFYTECRILRADDKTLRWLRLRGKVTFNEAGDPVRLAGTVVDVTDDRRRKEALKHVEKHFPTAFNNASVGIVISHIDSRFTQVNNAFGQLTGYSPEKLADTTYAGLFHPDDLQQYQTQVSELLASQSGAVISQVRCFHKEGHVLWLNVHTTLVYDESGRPESFFSIVQDITQDVAARDEQQKLLTLVDSSLSFMAVADLEGRLTYINKAGRELIGMEATAGVKPIMVADFYTPEQYSWLMEVAIPTLLSEGHWSGRLSLKHFKTGELIPCYANGIRVDDPITGRPIGRGFMMRDLRPELAAQETQRKLFTLVDNSVELMSILEMDGTNSYINKAGMAMLGFDNEQQVQEIPISNLHAPEHFALVEQEVLPSVLNTGRWSGEMLVRHLKTGEIFPVFNNTIRIDDPHSGQPIAVGAVMRDMRPERLAQQALLASEERFRSMIMQAPVAMGLLGGEQLIIESANEFILNLWGKGADIIGKPLLNALPEIEGQAFPDLLANVYQSGKPYHGYEVLTRLYRNGRLEDCYFNFVYAPVRENSGSISGIIVVATEVTAQVQAMRELEESEKRFRNLILDAPIATAVYAGPDMVIQLANDAMLSLWGKDASVIGKTLRDAIPELDGQPFHQLLDNVYTTGTVYQGIEDKTDLIIDGRLQTFYFNFTYKPLRDATGTVYAILNMAVDITYQVKAKQQLQQAQESLREAVDLAELAPWTSNVLTGEMVCSPRVNEWLGVTETITPDIISRCIHPKDLPHVARVSEAAMTQPETGGRMDMEYTVINQQTQQELILRTQAQVIFNKQGAPYLVRGTSQDITAQRMTEQALEKQVQLRTEELIQSNLQLKQSNQELERYAYVASHDLQEPLRKIQMYADLLRENYLKDISPEGRSYLTKVEQSASRMTMLIRNILDFSRINYESGFVDQVDLNAIVEAVVNDFNLLISQKNGRVDLSNLCVIEAIPLQMTQLFHNLIGNALKFSREGVPPVVTISCRPLTEQELKPYEKLNSRLPHCEIIVSDNGIGFNPTFGEKIFGLFQRLHHQQKYEGTGIGLSLCQRIIFNHQGEIWAEAEEGKGAAFHLFLPMKR